MPTITLNNVAPKDVADAHYANKSNPHEVTAAQVGAYTISEVDAIVATLVPYTGATQDLDMGGFGVLLNHAQFNLTPTGVIVPGRMQWQDDVGTVRLGLKNGDVTNDIGLQQHCFITNKDTVDMVKGDVVYIDGAQGNRLAAKLASASTEITSDSTIGIVEEAINKNNSGFIIILGLIKNLNASGTPVGEIWGEGDTLYLSTTPGKLTNVAPTTPDHIVTIGYVVRNSATVGQIFVNVEEGAHLSELHDVLIASPLGGHYLEYDKANTYWKNVGVQHTVELIDELSVDYYPPYANQISGIAAQKNAATITVLVNGSAYSYGDAISAYDKVTVSASVADVVSFNINVL